jgi:hypothetical protein
MDLRNRRVSAVRDALLQAGVPSYKIQTGAFGNPDLPRDRRVEGTGGAADRPGSTLR